jgi:hypothetical protein
MICGALNHEKRRNVIVAATSSTTIVATSCLRSPTRDDGSNGKVDG